MTVQLRQSARTLAARTDGPAEIRDAAVRGGLARGTTVLTARGAIAVETLVPGDRVVTRERGLVPLMAIERTTRPTCVIPAHSLGHARPERDTRVAACQHLTLRDWRVGTLFAAGTAMIPAKRLCDGRQIVAEGETELFRLVFDLPQTIYADGLEVPTGRTEPDVIEVATDA